VLGLCGSAARAQEPTLFLGDGPNTATAQEVKNVLLRPNAAVPFYAYVANPGQGARVVTAELLSAEGRVIARATGVNVPGSGRAPVTFPAPVAPPVAAAAGTTPAPAAAGAIALTGSKIGLRLLDEQAQNKEIYRSDLDMAIQPPSQYAGAKASFTGTRDGANELQVTVTLNGPVAGGPVKVHLDLGLVPGFVPGSPTDAAYDGEATAGAPAVLKATNMRFTGEAKKGWVAVTVDGYDRAFLFETAFDGTTPQRPTAENVIRIVCPPAAQPTNKFPVRIEVDQPTRADAYIDFGFDKSGRGAFQPTTLPGDRDRAVTLRLGDPGGALLFEGVVKDWVVNVNATGVLGPRTFRARLLAPKSPDQKTLDPVNDPELKDGERPAVDTRQVVFDNTPPADVTLTAPVEHVRGTPLKVRATAVDAESGIDRVLFFVGDPSAADMRDVRAAVRGKVFVAEPPPSAGGAYTAVLPMADTKGRAVVGVRVINGVGLYIDKAADVELVDPVVKPKPTTGDIKGVVEQGSPPRRQPGRTVWLLDEKQSAVLKTTEANAKGEFAFKDVAPGNYVVRSDKPTDYATARKAATVEVGKTTEVVLTLKR
jgi:hypothetical protein